MSKEEALNDVDIDFSDLEAHIKYIFEPRKPVPKNILYGIDKVKKSIERLKSMQEPEPVDLDRQEDFIGVIVYDDCAQIPLPLYEKIKSIAEQGHLRTKPEPIDGLEEAISGLDYYADGLCQEDWVDVHGDIYKLIKAAKTYSKLVKGE